MEEQIERPGDSVGATGLVSAEVVELAEHDVDADRRDETGHHRVGHEAQERAESEQARDDHHDARQNRQCEQRTCRVVTAGEIDVGDDDRHCAGRLDRHECRTGEERPTDHAVEVAVETCHRVHTGQQATREAIGDALDTEHEARHRVVLRRLAPEE